MIVYLHICYDRERITETFAVRLNHPCATDGLEDTGLFKNIPSSEMISQSVYLVAQVVEEIELNSQDFNKKPQLNKIKKEVAVGATDISKLFSNQPIKSSDKYLFKIRLYRSYTDLITEPEYYQFDNDGWGATVDRIIEGSKAGLIMNPRAERLIVSLQNIKHQDKVGFDDNMVSKTIPSFHPVHFYPWIEKHECLYLRMGRVLLENTKKNELLTIEVSAPRNNLFFANASNESYKRNWKSLTVGPNESIGELVRINGFLLKNNNEQADYILFSLYVNGGLTAEGRIVYKSGDRLITDNKSYSIELISIRNYSIIASVNIYIGHVSKIFNTDININNLLQYEEHFRNGEVGIRQLSASLIAFHHLDLHLLVRYFNQLLRALFSIADISAKFLQSESCQNLKYSTFSGIAYMLDTVFGGNDRYLYLIAMFTRKSTSLPPIGTFIIESISNILFQAEKTWTSTSIQACRIASILMNFAIKSMDNSPDLDEYFKAVENICEAGSYFLSLKADFCIDSQVQIIDILDDILSYNLHIDDVEALKFIVRFIDSIGIKGLGIDGVLYITNKVYITNKNARTVNAHRIILSKLLVIQRLFYTKLVKEPATRKTLLSKAVEWAMEVLQGQTDVSASRIACSILNCACTLLWGIVIEEKNREEVQLCYSLTKLLPSISRAIIKYERFTRENGFYKPKTKFTHLFPSGYPFTEAQLIQLLQRKFSLRFKSSYHVFFVSLQESAKKLVEMLVIKLS